MSDMRKNMKKFRLSAIVLGALLVIAVSSCSVSINGYARNPPTIYATLGYTGYIDVTWSAVSDAVAYNVYDTTNPNSYIYLGKGSLGGSGTYYFYRDIPIAGTYYYRVESVFPDGGTSALSAEVMGHAY